MLEQALVVLALYGALVTGLLWYVAKKRRP